MYVWVCVCVCDVKQYFRHCNCMYLLGMYVSSWLNRQANKSTCHIFYRMGWLSAGVHTRECLSNVRVHEWYSAETKCFQKLENQFKSYQRKKNYNRFLGCCCCCAADAYWLSFMHVKNTTESTPMERRKFEFSANAYEYIIIIIRRRQRRRRRWQQNGVGICVPRKKACRAPIKVVTPGYGFFMVKILYICHWALLSLSLERHKIVRYVQILFFWVWQPIALPMVALYRSYVDHFRKLKILHWLSSVALLFI